MKDLIKIKKFENCGIMGVISGRAIYEKKLDIIKCNILLEENAKN